MSVQDSINRLNSIKERIRTNLVAQGIVVPEDAVLAYMAEQILSVAGEPGYTPVKGVDYWTPEDQSAVANQAAAKITATIVGNKLVLSKD